MSTYVVNINERIAQRAADSWDQAARAVFVFLRREHCRVFLGDDFVVVQRRAGYSAGQVVARLAQARYPAQILIFSR